MEAERKNEIAISRNQTDRGNELKNESDRMVQQNKLKETKKSGRKMSNRHNRSLSIGGEIVLLCEPEPPRIGAG